MNIAAPLQQNLQAVQAAIRQACNRSARSHKDVTLMAVTKYAADADVLALLDTGKISHIGESRVQQAQARWTRPEFAKYPVIKHFIGHLQKNKAAQAAALFDFIDSIDNLETAQLLNEHAGKLNKTLRILVQIKLTDRETQSGIAIAQALINEVIDRMVQAGVEPPVFVSSNVDGGDERNDATFKKYYGYWK